nr:OmpA family protein [uncultured Niameybacter sp.]
MQFKYDKLFGNTQENSDFWPSFTDMLTTILLVVILAFSLVVGGYAVTTERMQQDIEAQGIALEAAQGKINTILWLKNDIINNLEDAFKSSDLGIRIDVDTGDLYVDSNILFDYGSANLKPEAKKELQEFIPKYIGVLFEYEDSIEEIIVEGHTDHHGGYLFNLKLSQDRAFNVVSYILSDAFGDFPYKEKMRNVITANGRSYSQLIYKKDANGKDTTEVDQTASRRVVFKFRTTLEEALKEEIQKDY